MRFPQGQWGLNGVYIIEQVLKKDQDLYCRTIWVKKVIFGGFLRVFLRTGGQKKGGFWRTLRKVKNKKLKNYSQKNQSKLSIECSFHIK